MLRREFLIGTLALTTFPTSSFAFPDTLIVNRTETCGCCGAWAEKMDSAGLRTEVNYVDEEALGLIKTSFLIAIYLAPSSEKGIDSVDLDANSLNEKR